MASSRSAKRVVLHVAGDSGGKLFGLTPRERLIRQFARAGIAHTATIEAASESDAVIIVGGHAAIDQPLVQLLAEGEPRILLDEAEARPLAICCPASQAQMAAAVLAGEVAKETLGLPASTPAGLKADFWKSLRKKETPYALRLSSANAAAVEWRIFMGTYKGATDLVTKHLWPRPAFHVTRLIAPIGITPNMVTTLGAAMTVLAFWLFLQGHFATGLLAAWAMTFLDTVDGKLARTTLTSSKWGDVFDHGIDLVHPPFWYCAWALGLAKSGYEWSSPMFWWVTGLILAGYVLQRAMEGIAIKWLGLEIHIWRKIDTLFRQVTARRNPNLVILSAATLLGRPDVGLIAVAAWTVICLVLHGLQLLQALATPKQDGKLVSWMMRP
jgi:phosphatidylglycerophosphate synthase